MTGQNETLLSATDLQGFPEVVLDTTPLCPTCRWNELRRYLLAGVPTEGRGCAHHIVSFPAARTCDRYEREPGAD